MLKIAVLAPIPRTRMRIEIALNPGFLRNMRSAKRTSETIPDIGSFP